MTAATAPASSANLGPGFDVLGLALDIRCRVTASPAEGWRVTDGDGVEDPGLRALVWGVAGDAAPHRVVVESSIPIGRGLGSSAAIRVAARAALEASAGEVLPARVFRTAVAAEGHSDNAAAAMHGGLVAVGAAGEIRRLSIHPSLSLVIAVPRRRLATEEARAALGESVERGVAVRTASRLAYLIEGLRSADPEALAAAGGDEMHELSRRALSPVSAELVSAARVAGALHAAWSGAGPSVIAFAGEEHADRVEAAMSETLGGEGAVLRPGVDLDGLRLE